MAAIAAVIVVCHADGDDDRRGARSLRTHLRAGVAGLIGIATPDELFAGLSNGGVITIAAMLVVAKGVLYTGVVSRVTYRLLAGVSRPRQALRLIPPIAAPC